MYMELYQSTRGRKQSNIRNSKQKKLKKNSIGTFYRPSKFHSLFNEKGGNSKEI